MHAQQNFKILLTCIIYENAPLYESSEREKGMETKKKNLKRKFGTRMCRFIFFFSLLLDVV